RKAGIQPDQIDHFLIAGAFGNYLDLGSAIEIGMFPDVPLERYSQIGNAAGAGARMLLVNHSQRTLAEKTSREIDYVELTAEETFNDIYVSALFMEKNGNLNQLL
ncbi:MAG: ferredoxin, partial [Bacteroidetes bacterium]